MYIVIITVSRVCARVSDPVMTLVELCLFLRAHPTSSTWKDRSLQTPARHLSLTRAKKGSVRSNEMSLSSKEGAIMFLIQINHTE